MVLFRFILLLAISGGLVAIAAQNTDLITLTVLGQKTIALPLWAWLAGAIGLGGMTSIFLTGLIEWTAFWSRRTERKSVQSAAPTAAKPSKPRWNPFGGGSEDDAWDEAPAGQGPQAAANTGQRSGYRSPAPPKEVVDADFRVIRPPSRQLDDE
jgi:hypothetical protein